MRIAEILDPKNFRYERKYLFSSLMPYHLEAVLRDHPGVFSESYPERFVNNIYFDTLDMSHYRDNVSGVSPRVKVRIRWYGTLFGEVKKPVLEFKVKKNMMGSKISYSLNPFKVDKGMSLDSIKDGFKNLNIPEFLREYLLTLDLSLMNRYRRKYFITFSNQFRATIDSDLVFIEASSGPNYFLNKTEKQAITILELKYDEKYDNEASLISNYFPFRMTKSSKYLFGLQKIHTITD